MIVTIILLLALLFNINVNMFATPGQTVATYLKSMNGFAEVSFFVCNILSSAVNEDSFLLFMVSNYVKIINAVRVSEILAYL